MSNLTPNGGQPTPVPAHAPITMQDVTKSFGKVGVFDMNLEVPEGTILGLIGPSGCGKTTTVRLLTGVYRQDRGFMQVLGEEPGAFSTGTRALIGYMPQHYLLSPRLTVWETLSFVSSLYGLPWLTRRRRLHRVLDFVELGDTLHKPVGQLSGGMQRRLALASMLVHDPPIMFADEPTAGVDPVLRSKFWTHFRELRERGHTLLITTQYVAEAEHCDRVALLRDGRLLTVDTPEGLRRRALGGDPFSLRVPAARQHEASQIIDQQPYVRRVTVSRDQPGVLHVTVDDAASAMPRLTRLLATESGITVEHAEEFRPSFDEIFVGLMERAQTGEGVPEAPVDPIHAPEEAHG